MRYKILFIILAAVGLLVAVGDARAQGAPRTGINLTLSPVFINLTTDPGVKVSNQFKIKNNNNIKEELQLSVAKFVSSPNGEQPVIQEVGKDDEFVQWISFSEKKFTVDPNEIKTIKFTIEPSKTASLGYYYAIVISRVNEAALGQSGSVVSGSPALPILLEVRSPNAKRELKLKNFVTTSLWYEYLPTEFKIQVQNSGNIHIVPSGDIFIDWGGSKDLAVIPANGAHGNVLPNSQRTFTAIWDDGFITRIPKVDANGKELKNDKGQIQYTTKWNWEKFNKFRIGKYTAHLLMIYDNGQRDVPLEATVSFWVIPWKILLGALVIGYFALMGVKNTLSGWWKRIRNINKP